MRFLLDTHTFIWAISEPEKLPQPVREQIADTSNSSFVSAVTFWEITIKTRIGKLGLGWSGDLIAEAERAGIEPIPLEPVEAATYDDLAESAHTDPFDRMLAWQAISKNMVLVSRDRGFESFKPYGLKLIWK